VTNAFRRLLLRLRGPLLRFDMPGDDRLIVCHDCGARLMNPMAWHESGEAAWWIRLRCGACGNVRTSVFSNELANRLERDLAPGLREIERAVARLDQERMRREADAFITALARDLIGPGDFSRRAAR
jgi:hypothetical protein